MFRHMDNNSIPSCSNKILCLHFHRAHLSILGVLLDILDELLFLNLELRSLSIEFTLRLLQSALVFPQPLCGRHALAKRPFYYLMRYIS